MERIIGREAVRAFWGRRGAVAIGAAVAMLALGGGCTDGGEADGCAGRQDGCCLNGVWVAPQNLTDSACGYGGMTCRPCVAENLVCNVALGQCQAPTGTSDPYPPPVECVPACDPFTHVCINGTCQPLSSGDTTFNPAGCNPPCNSATEVCIGGKCEPIGGTNPGTTECAWCQAPNVCHEGRCMDKPQYCRLTCKGCCQSNGTCLDLGASGGQTADRCGNDGDACSSCTSVGLSCNTANGTCGTLGGGKVRICLHSATIDGSYEDKCGWGAPDAFVQILVGKEPLTTQVARAVRAYKTTGDRKAPWIVGWVGQCREIDLDEAHKNGIDLAVYDQDAGFCGSVPAFIGKCKTNPSAWSMGFGQKFSISGSMRCTGMLEEIWIEVLPQ